MSEELLPSESAPDPGNELDQLSPATDDSGPPGWDDPSRLVLVVNAVSVGLGGVYASTRSIIITVVAAGLVAVLALCSVASMRRGS